MRKKCVRSGRADKMGEPPALHPTMTFGQAVEITGVLNCKDQFDKASFTKNADNS
jgi:hypothetical protein